MKQTMIVLAIVSLGYGATVCQAQEFFIIYPDDDTYVSSNPAEEDSSFCNEPWLIVQNGNFQNEKYIYLQFRDLSAIQGPLIIASLQLAMLLEEPQSGVPSAYGARNPWNECSATWNNDPGCCNPGPYPGVKFTRDGREWYQFDVTDLVAQWLEGSQPNWGFAIDVPDGSPGELYFASKEGSIPARDPHLRGYYQGDGIEESELADKPISSVLLQNIPNPFSSTTTISYQLPKATHTQLSIYDLTGSLVRKLVEGDKDSGSYKIIWDKRNKDGEEVQSGIYFYRLQAGDFTSNKKMILLN